MPINKITNKAGLPEAIVRAVQNDKYSSGGADFSVTGLIAPAWLSHLKREHYYDEDASNLIFALLGQAVHSILERGGKYQRWHKACREERFHAEVDGVTISGAVDLIENCDTISDFKVCSVYKREAGPDWEAQLNMYRWLAMRDGLKTARFQRIKKLQVIAIYRDWSATAAERDASYPQSQVAVLPVKRWTCRQTLAYIRSRIAAHTGPQAGPCSDKERWAKPGGWAVMKEGRKAAVRVFDNEAEAVALALELGKGHSVVQRPTTYTRCEKYCPVAHVCPHAPQKEAPNA